MKRFLLLFVTIAAVAFTGCSKEDSHRNGLSDNERNVLAVLNGKFECTESYNGVVTWHETIVFTPFNEPQEKLSQLSGVPMKFHGTMNIITDVGMDGYERDCYFHISTEKNQLIINGIVDDGIHFSIVVAEINDYKIIDTNTISLRDVRYNSWHKFIRK